MPRIESKLGTKLKSAGVEIKPKSHEQLWKGPEVDGVTQSMLSSFLVCRERFRVKTILGLRSADGFNSRMEYGQMWHILEECHAHGKRDGAAELKEYCKGLCKRYPLQQEDVLKWYNVCLTQFPIYVEFWAKNKDVVDRTPVFQEEVFDVPYELPSGRVVRLRGKFDAVDAIGKGKAVGIYLQENKTKGDIDELKLQRQLQFDLQTMLYLVALDEIQSERQLTQAKKNPPIRGVRYNVIRRPLSGGRGSIRKHQATKNKAEETDEEYYARLGAIMEEESAYFFMRWKVEISQSDVARFCKMCLNPLLESLCQWYDWIKDNPDPFAPNPHHFTTPFGLYHALAEGGSTDVDEYILEGNEVGLQRADRLFGELQ